MGSLPLYVRLALAKRKDPLPAVKGKGLRDRKSTPDRFWLLAEVGRAAVWKGRGAGSGQGMWRGLEPHRGVDASWQAGDFFFPSWKQPGSRWEEAGGKGTQVWGWAGRKSWEHTGVSGPGGHPSGQGRGWNRCGQLGPGCCTPTPGRAAHGPLCKGKTKGRGASYSRIPGLEQL